MAENFLIMLFEHNNWANQQVIQACLSLNDGQLDAPPQSVTMGTIRQTLTHLVTSQRGYLALLTLPREARPTTPLALAELQESARTSGEGLLALARGEVKEPLPTRVQSRDGSFIEAWVVMVQVINHATEHREQIKSMLSALGLTPPEIDGWDFGRVSKAISTGSD